MNDYEKFKKRIYQFLNIDLSSYKEKQMKRRINFLVERNNFNGFNEYFEGIKKNSQLLDEFLNYITINVSEFYRNPTQWGILEKDILPNLVKSNNKLSIWSSACSTGEEPYSMIMLLTKYYDLNNIQILATDIDLEALNKAKKGFYTEKSIKNLPSEFIDKYFTKSDNNYIINDKIKNRVVFKKMDLISDKYPKGIDLILCRNVMIYFTDEAKLNMYNKFYSSLNNNGILFVGSTEQIILPERYKFKPVKTFFYKKILE